MIKKLLILLIVLVILGELFWLFKDDFITKEPLATKEVLVTLIAGEPGKYLADSTGRTLYTFDGDKDMESTCVKKCLEQWPIFENNNKARESYSDPLSKHLNIVEREDGLSQYSYGGKPLYYYMGDKKPGEINGNGADGMWHLVLFP